MDKDSRIFVAGHRGMVGSAIYRRLQVCGYGNIVVRTHRELDLTRQKETEDFFDRQRPDYVFLSAARVGGILANSTYTADFIYQNIMIAANVVQASYKYGVKKNAEPWLDLHLSQICAATFERRSVVVRPS